MSTLFKCICSQSKASDVRLLDYRHNGLLEVPGSVFLHERHLEVLHLDSNRISDLPRVSIFIYAITVYSISSFSIPNFALLREINSRTEWTFGFLANFTYMFF